MEYASRPENLPEEITWTSEIPAEINGVLLATEWLDNVPLDVAVHTADGWRYLLVDPQSGAETVGEPVSPADLEWLTRWWPTSRTSTDGDPNSALTWSDATSGSESGFGAARPAPAPNGKKPSAGCSRRPRRSGHGQRPGDGLHDQVALHRGPGRRRQRPGCPETPHSDHRAEIGRSRDEAWANAVRQIERGLALAVDYGHLRERRPVDGTLTGYRGGRQVPPVPDGSSDVTAHVAMDSVASAGSEVARCAYSLVLQREALRALGADGGRPPLSLAGTDPAGYVRALAAASAVAELTDPAGLGGHWWLRQPVGIPHEPAVAR
ncbi:SAM-dependent methyltransferase [Micromonospora zamorensis]|uniref:SAM-dependent methyltransferase n=1 Tax=Micromonospora zamorensis TaxID=709883 RepID=UPI003F4D38AD